MLTTTMCRAKAYVEELKTIKISARQLAVVVGISQTRLANGLADINYLGSEVEKEIAGAAHLLLKLADSAYPLRLPDDAQHLRKLYLHIKDNGIEPDQIRTAVQSLFGVSE